MLKKIIIFGGILLVIFVVGIQLIPYGRDHTNPPVTSSPNWDSEQTRDLFYRACADCHSNETKWPWYSNIAPVSWLVYRDVMEGREKFNISTLNSGGKNEADEAAEAVKEGEMPMPIYLITHPEARLSDAEKGALIQGLVNTFGTEHGD